MSSSISRARPAKRESSSSMVFQRSSTDAPGTGAVVANAPASTIGLVRPSALRSTASTGLTALPVALTQRAIRAGSGPIRSQTMANTKGFATLRMVNGTSWSSAGYTDEFYPSTTDAKVR